MDELNEAEDHEYYLVQAMLKYGGSFVKALAECYERADHVNKAKLRFAFNDILMQYHDMGLELKKIKEQQKDE